MQCARGGQERVNESVWESRPPSCTSTNKQEDWREAGSKKRQRERQSQGTSGGKRRAERSKEKNRKPWKRNWRLKQAQRLRKEAKATPGA